MFFAPTIFIEADALSFSFRYKSKTLAFATFLCESTGEKPIVLAVGSDPPVTAAYRRIELFGASVQPINYSDYLAAFLRHGTALISSGWAKFARPRFQIKVTRRLADAVGGYYDAVLRSAALQAGPVTTRDIVIEADW